MPRPPAASRMPSPTGTEPVNEIARTPGCSTSGVPTAEPRPITTFRTPARQPRVVQRAHDVQPGQRRVLRELQDDGVAVDQRRRELPHRDRGREVPRRDQADDADRAVHGVDRAAGDRLLEELADRAGTPRPPSSAGSGPPAPPPCAPRAAACPSRASCPARSPRRARRSAPPRRSARPRGGRSARAPSRRRASCGGLDGQVDVLARRARELADDLVRPRRVALLVRVAAGARAPLAGDVDSRVRSTCQPWRDPTPVNYPSRGQGPKGDP